MHRFPSFLIAVLCVCVAGILLAQQALAFDRPDGVGMNKPEFSRENHPTGEIQSHSQESGDTTTSSSARKEFFRFHQIGDKSFEGSGSSRMSAFAEKHLQGNKLNVCESVQKALTHRSTHLVSLVTTMEEKFTSIAKGVEQYYLNQVVPTGTTLSSYDSLVADITTKQDALTPLVAAAQSDVTNFSCTGNNPGASMTQYRTDMQAVKKGLQEYRTAIKNLIVAVRTLPSVSVTPTAEASAAPSKVPSTSGEPSPTSVTP